MLLGLLRRIHHHLNQLLVLVFRVVDTHGHGGLLDGLMLQVLLEALSGFSGLVVTVLGKFLRNINIIVFF